MKTKRIKMSEVKVGMKIKTMTSSGEITFREVTDKFNTPVLPEQQVRLEFKNGTVINCSTNHPILVKSGEDQIRVDPLDLTIDDEIITDSGLTRLKFRDIGQSNDPSYLDITVDDTHVFFTSESIDSPMVLTKNSQGGIRNASCTVWFPVWHAQFEDLIVLKNNQGTEETRVRQMDYGVVMHGLFWRRFKTGGNITLFDPHEVPDLYEAYYRNVDEFEAMYIKYEADTSIKRKVISAEDIIKNGILKERTDTGRIYLMNVDNIIRQGPFDTAVDPIYQSNLCAEINLPTRPFQRIEDSNGRLALCTLGSINWGIFRNPQDMRKACRILVRSLSNLLNYQDFLSVQSQLANQDFEPLGVGITNLAYWHARRSLEYGTSDSLAEVKRWMEHQAYYLTDASVELAQERGACAKSAQTYYGRGVFPWERRAAGVNELTDFTPSLDWESLRERLLKYGIRNATLMAVAPVESCQSWKNKLSLSDGTNLNFHELLDTVGIDWKKIENTADAGTVVKLPRIVNVDGRNGTEEVTEVVYNGFKPLNQITFEDGSVMEFTDNHRLLVNRNGIEEWVYVFNLQEGDDIIRVE